MGLLERIWTGTPQASTPNATDDFWYQSLSDSMMSVAGVRVTPDLALKISAVYAAVRIRTGTFGYIPWMLNRRLGNGGKERATNHPLYRVLHLQPNRRQTSMEFREQMMAFELLRGNAYARIVPGPRSFADELIPLHPDRMDPKLLDNGRIRYRYSLENGSIVDYDEEEILHVRSLIGSTDGITGVSRIRQAADELGIAVAAEKYAGKVFAQGGEVGVVLEHPETLGPDTGKRIEESWTRAHGGWTNAHKAVVLEEGMKATRIGLTAQDAQLLDSRQFSVTEIARRFGVPPHMIFDLTRSTNNNIEHQGIEYVTYHMMPDLVRWEQRATMQLLLDRDQDDYSAEFLVDGLLRGATLDRYRAYQLADFMSPNEKRERENLNPIEGLDEPLFALNKAPVGQMPGAVPQNTAEAPSPATNIVAKTFALEAAQRIIRREQTALERRQKQSGADDEAFLAAAAAFYEQEHAAWLATESLSEAEAAQWCEGQIEELRGGGYAVTGTWMERRAPVLSDVLLDGRSRDAGAGPPAPESGGNGSRVKVIRMLESANGKLNGVEYQYE